MPTSDPSDDAGTNTLLVITLAGLLLRGATAWLTIDIPGDGVTRALMAYHWSRSPQVLRLALLVVFGGELEIFDIRPG